MAVPAKTGDADQHLMPPPPPDTGDGGGGGGGGGGDGSPPGLDLGGVLGGIGGGTSSGGGSSTSSTGGSAPVDPQVSAAASFYYQLWGTKPPAGYIENFLNGTRDLFDFIKFQLSRPNADNQIFFRDRFATYAAQVASIMGRP